TAVLIVAPIAVEAPLLARRLERWGARVCLVPDETVAAALIPERQWDAILIDRALGASAIETLARSVAGSIARRIVLITPGERHELAGLKDGGFTGYLVKPVRAVSLAARLRTEDDRVDADVPAAAGDRPADAAEIAADGKALAILVAEDNDINALLARALLAKLGHRPTIAANGAAAIESWHAARAAGTPYDLVLMDVHMPE